MTRLALFSQFCRPAYVYFIVSVIFIIVFAVQNSNYYNNGVYCIGSYNCDGMNITLMFFLKLIFILFWTYVLNSVCSLDLPALSWFLVFLPWLVMLGFLASLLK
jgi:hypothetical protein